MQSEDGVGTGRLGIQIVLTDGLVQLAFEKTVQSFLFCVADDLGEALDGHTTPLIVGDLQILVEVDRVAARFVRQKVTDLLVVDLGVTDANRDGLIELVASERIHLRDGPRHDATVLEDRAAARLRVRLASSGLTVAEHSAIVAFRDGLDDLGGGHFVDFVLARIVQDLFEVELPDVSLIVDDACCLVLVLLERD